MTKVLLSQQPSHVGYANSYLITNVKQLWARTGLGWKSTWELLVLLTFVWISMLPLGEWTMLDSGIPTGGSMSC